MHNFHFGRLKIILSLLLGLWRSHFTRVLVDGIELRDQWSWSLVVQVLLFVFLNLVKVENNSFLVRRVILFPLDHQEVI